MITDGIKIVVNPEKWWSSATIPPSYTVSKMVTDIMAVVVIPVAVVTLGHLASFWLGYADEHVAIQRAAISFLTICAGAFAMVSALSLIFLKFAKNAHSTVSSEKIVAAAVAIVTSVWLLGSFQAIASFAAMNPETGEIIWMVLSFGVAIRIITGGTSEALGITRRWKIKFTLPSIISFALLFVLITIIPAMLMRYLIGVTGHTFYDAPDPVNWPLPLSYNW